jgi:hypothetical protein
MGKMSPDKIRKLALQGRLVPVIEQREDGKNYLIGYKRKAGSRKNDSFLLPEPELLPDISK